MKKAERLLYILSVLRTRKHLRARDLAQKCEVTERTIYRDICSISGSNIPIFFDDGYKLIHEGFMPPMNFTPGESAYLIEVLRATLAKKTRCLMAERIIDKLESALGAENRMVPQHRISHSTINRIKVSKN